MPNKIRIVTDSTSSLSQEECKAMNIECLETTYMIDEKLFSAFENKDETLEDFYSKLDGIKSCSTGCVNVQTFEDCFDAYAKNGEQVVYTGLSSSLSSTFENSKMAAQNINEKYGKKMVAVVDSRSASYGVLILLEMAENLIQAGKTLDEIELALNDEAKSMSVAFVARDLSFLQKSGRIGIVEASVGKILHIVPIVYVSESGSLKTGDKCLGTKKALTTLKLKFVNFIKNKNHTKCYITSCALNDEVEEIKKYILENTDVKEVKIGLIDKTLACCCGPKTIAIFCG
jgi:DegV family protein with EDD domain